MSEPHVIRLHGPWRCWPRSHQSATEQASALTIDCRDENGLGQLRHEDLPPRVLFGRRFHRPTGLTAASTVHLVVESASRQLTLSLNSRPLGTIDAGQHPFDVSQDLQAANQLRIEVPADAIGQFRVLTDLFACQLEID